MKNDPLVQESSLHRAKRSMVVQWGVGVLLLGLGASHVSSLPPNRRPHEWRIYVEVFVASAVVGAGIIAVLYSHYSKHGIRSSRKRSARRRSLVAYTLLALVIAGLVLQIVLTERFGTWVIGVAIAAFAITFFTGDAMFLQPLLERLRKVAGDRPVLPMRPLF